MPLGAAGWTPYGDVMSLWSASCLALTAVLCSTAVPTEALAATAPESAESRASFYDRLESSTDPDAPSSPKGVAEAGQQSLLVNLLHLRRGAAGVGFFRAYREDLKGFAVGWLIAAGLVLGTAFLLGS